MINYLHPQLTVILRLGLEGVGHTGSVVRHDVETEPLVDAVGRPPRAGLQAEALGVGDL